MTERGVHFVIVVAEIDAALKKVAFSSIPDCTACPSGDRKYCDDTAVM